MQRQSGFLAELDWKSRRNQILSALKEFDSRHPEGTTRTGKKYFIWYAPRAYPPKEIRSILERRPTRKFSGGGKTNDIFRDLGFPVVKGTDLFPLFKKSMARQSRLKRQNSKTSILLRTLLREKWSPLSQNLESSSLGSAPGVYLLAYPSVNLNGKHVRVEDVFYVGMSTTALNTRLKQFWDGIHRYCCHSAAMRFYKRWAGNRSYSKLKQKKVFYVATVPVKCETKKELRTPYDLQLMGSVAELEFAVLAYIKKRIGLEPPLNKK
jgi:hypothetical protein